MLVAQKLVSSFVVTLVVACFATAVGCSSTTSKGSSSSSGGTKDGGSSAARPASKPRTASLKGKAGSTPPAGARSAGPKTQPKAGAVTVPITNVEVYTFDDTFSDDGAAQTFEWAYVQGTGTFLWTSGPVTCADGSTDPAGAFLMGVAPDGTGTYVFSLGGCPSSDLFGCDFDAAGNETACGACQVQDDTIVCATAG
ncbi:MAG: hypothetical protein JWP97_1222 [Labilithrix sp.]|nr:hypothetical protein [Labilithrix sp.]